jgi:V/A-type H+-transporting ATPase subunit C
MGISKIKYPTINAKLKAMYGKHLSNSDLIDLVKQVDIQSVVSQLKSKFIPLETIKDNATRIEIEDTLDNVLIEDINKIQKYLSSSEKEIFLKFVSKYEIKCLKSVLKNLLSSSKIENNMADVEVWTNTIFKNINGITKSRNINEYVSIAQKSSYWKQVNTLLETKEINVFEFETALDKAYFEILYSEIEEKSLMLKKLVGTRIDILNILWILRSKKYYHTSNQELSNLLIPIYYNLKKSTVNELITSANYEEAREILSKTYYKNFSNSEIYDLERETKKYFKHECEIILKQSRFDLSFIFAYIYLSEYQQDNIIHIIGGIFYNLDKQKIEQELIL